VSEYAPTVVSFPVQRVRDLEQGCAGLFERGMLPVTRLLESLGAAHRMLGDTVSGCSSPFPRFSSYTGRVQSL
jgi:hypothetical protein